MFLGRIRVCLSTSYSHGRECNECELRKNVLKLLWHLHGYVCVRMRINVDDNIQVLVKL